MNSSQPTERSQPETYQVVARKYRPQSFETLIGQGHIATALSNAINQSRVGHAYLFTGARGVGKTSSARIFAKCLNCVNGPTTTPCSKCDICESISIGEDVDVLEIDGASNRGIDEIRSLRSNAAIRPSRARFKIYIIDEVHMLTTQAFNALLKTLEEPPKHVKFIFCTTDPHKIPITVLSRCQRFDFSPVQINQIAESLKSIVEKEGKTIDAEALNLLARRANGSMRDSQSLLEQIFSFCGDHISASEVHQLLGTADLGRIAEMARAMISHDPTAALSMIHQASSEGIDSGQLAGQLLSFFRDLMAVKLNCSVDALLVCSESDLGSLNDLSSSIGLETILAMLQLLDQAVVKMQSSLHARTLLEMAAIRICNLENLDAIPDLVKRLSESGAPTSTVKPLTPKASSPPTSPAPKPPADSKKNEIAKPSSPSTSSSTGVRTHTSIRSDPPHPSEPDSPTAQVSRAESALTVSAASISTEASRADSFDASAGATEFEIATDWKGHSFIDPESTAQMDSDEDIEADFEEDSSEELLIEDTSENIKLTAFGLTSDSLWARWREMSEQLKGMTPDMIREPENLELLEGDVILATLRDAYTVRECLKVDRRQMIEKILSEICNQSLRVDFRPSANAVNKAETATPQLPRAQQLRILLEHDFVKQTMEIFSAEITNFYQRHPNQHPR